MQLFDITNFWHSFTLSRQTKLYIAACTVCFFFFYALFYAVLYGQTQSETYLTHWTQQASAYGIVLSSPKVQFFPPAISIATIEITGENNTQLSLHKLDIALSIFSATASFDVQVLEGSLKGTIQASSLFSPERLAIDLQCTDIALPQLASFAGLRKTGALVQLLQGTLNATVITDIPLKAQGKKGLNLAASTGTIKVQMHNIAITHGLPLLVASRLEDLQGEAEITWDKRKIHVQQIRVTNPMLYINLDGAITANMLKPLDSTVDIRAIVRMPLDQLHTEFVPPRTLRALQEKKQVRMDITQTLRNPKVNVKL